MMKSNYIKAFRFVCQWQKATTAESESFVHSWKLITYQASVAFGELRRYQPIQIGKQNVHFR